MKSPVDALAETLARLHAIADVTASVGAAAKYVPESRYNELTIALSAVLACIADTDAAKMAEHAAAANARMDAKRATERKGML